jgi:hypothetical protein
LKNGTLFPSTATCAPVRRLRPGRAPRRFSENTRNHESRPGPEQDLAAAYKPPSFWGRTGRVLFREA